MCTFYLYEQSTADQQYKVAKANALAFDHLLMNKWKNERNLWMSACTFCVYIMLYRMRTIISKQHATEAELNQLKDLNKKK